MKGWIILAFLVGALAGYSHGWMKAHQTVAVECQRLGSFYVGSQVFRCTAIEEKSND